MIEKWSTFLYTGVHAGMEYKINRVHERALRLIYPNQNQLTFKELLEKKNKTNLQTLASEIHKGKSKISSGIVNSLCKYTNKSYDLRNASILKRKRNFTGHGGSENLSSLAPKIWELIPDSIRFNKVIGERVVEKQI